MLLLPILDAAIHGNYSYICRTYLACSWYSCISVTLKNYSTGKFGMCRRHIGNAFMAVVETITGMSLTEFSGCVNDSQGQLYMHKYTLQCDVYGIHGIGSGNCTKDVGMIKEN